MRCLRYHRCPSCYVSFCLEHSYFKGDVFASEQYPKPPDKCILSLFSKGSNQNAELMLSRL